MNSKLTILLALCGVALTKTYDPLRVEDFQALNFTQQLDHFNFKDKRDFIQRFWVNDKYWDNKTGPIFLYICGEGTCHPPSERGFPFQVCQDLNCLFYVLEHRYYGASQPFSDWSSPNLKYLNSTQALADLDYFIKNRTVEINNQFGPGVRKWMSIGGSYPGALSAWFKSQYPTTVDVAWSSSGVIHAIRDFTDYDLDVYYSTGRSGDDCTTTIQGIVQYIDKALKGQLPQPESDYVKQLFKIPDDLDYGDFMYYLADIFAGKVQYGARRSLCSILQSIKTSTVSVQLPVVKQIADQMGMTDYSGYDRKNLQNITYDINKNMRQWTWQVCTEFGWFQVPDPNHPMRSDLIGPQYWSPFCEAVFGKEYASEPAVDFYNSLYGGLNITGSQIVFANAIEDPWQYAGMRSIYNATFQSGMEAVLINCEDCAHCVDLKTPSATDAPTLTNARNRIKRIVTQWLTPTQEELDKAFGKIENKEEETQQTKEFFQ